MIHDLKVWPEAYKALRCGLKTYEVRVNDRGFQVGDVLRLRLWEPATGDGGHAPPLLMRVVHMTKGGTWGLPDNVCVMGVERSGK